MKKDGWKKFWRVLGLASSVFAGVLGVELLLGLILTLILPAEVVKSTLFNVFFSVISYVLAIFLIIFLPPRIFKKIPAPSRASLGLSGLPTWTDIGLSVPGYVITILLTMGLTTIFNLFPWFNSNETQNLGFSPYMVGAERALAFVLLAVLAPIFEEIIFRGFFYGKLRIMIPKWLAILLTSLLFGLIHLQWNVGIAVFCMSVVSCVLREVTGTIYAGMLVHIINNTVAFCLVYVIGTI